MKQETKDALEVFIEKAYRLRSLGFNQKAEKISFRWTWKKEGEELEILGPDREQMEAFVLTLRFFIQKKEHSSFRWLDGNVLDDAGLSNHWKQEFEKIRNKLNEYLDKPPEIIPLRFSDGSMPTCREILYTFLYGDLAHVEKPKREEYKRWMSMPKIAQGMLQTQFLQILKNLYEAINYIAGLTEKELNKG